MYSKWLPWQQRRIWKYDYQSIDPNPLNMTAFKTIKEIKTKAEQKQIFFGIIDHV